MVTFSVTFSMVTFSMVTFSVTFSECLVTGMWWSNTLLWWWLFLSAWWLVCGDLDVKMAKMISRWPPPPPQPGQYWPQAGTEAMKAPVWTLTAMRSTSDDMQGVSTGICSATGASRTSPATAASRDQWTTMVTKHTSLINIINSLIERDRDKGLEIILSCRQINELWLLFVTPV